MYKKIVEYGWYIIDRLFSKFRKPMRCGYLMEYEKYKDLIEREIKWNAFGSIKGEIWCLVKQLQQLVK